MSNPATSAVVWIESNNWELDFFGLPHRIPWPADVNPAEAAKDPFQVDHLLNAIEALGPEAADPWKSFYQGSASLDEFGEAVQHSEIVRAYTLLEEFDRVHPGTAFALYHRGSLARLEGDDEGAVELFQQALEKVPKGVPIWNSLGVVQASRGLRDEAVKAFKEALAISPQDRTALEGLAQLREIVKLLRKADDPNSAFFMDLPTFGEMALRQVQQLENDPNQLLNYGEQLLREGFAPAAGLQALERAQAALPDEPRAVFGLAAAYRTQNRLPEAKTIVTAFTQKHPEDPRGFFQLAQLCNLEGDAAGEAAALDRVLEIDPNAQAPLGIRFALANGEHDPLKEEALAKFGAERRSWMAYILASNIARQRAAAKPAVKWAECAYEIAPELEDVLLHYTAALGEARDFEKLVKVIKPHIDSGKFTKRLNWNYAQVLQQVGLTEDAIRTLREAIAGEVPEDFKAAAETMIRAWSGELAGCGVPLEVHQAGFLQRPVLLTIDEEDGGIVLAAGATVPISGTFPWKMNADRARIALQQGESEGSVEPTPLGSFMIQGAKAPATIECHLTAQKDGALHFHATQEGRPLKVGWAPPAQPK